MIALDSRFVPGLGSFEAGKAYSLTPEQAAAFQRQGWMTQEEK